MHKFALMAAMLWAFACDEKYPDGSIRSDLKVGLVTDGGKITDGTFNQIAYEGGVQAAKDFGLQFDYRVPDSNDTIEHNIQTFIDSGYDLIVTVGFLMTDVTKKMAEQNPDTKFAIVDVTFEETVGNLIGLGFAEDQAGYLAGALAGQVTVNQSVAVVGGLSIPPVKRFVNGFVNGAKRSCPDCAVHCSYVMSFGAPAAGAEEAKSLIALHDVDVLFGAGGATGSGGILEAAGQGIGVIGVDMDEYHTTFKGGAEPSSINLLASATKRIDVAVYKAIQKAIDENFEPGNLIFDLPNDGVSLSGFHSNRVSSEARNAVASMQSEMAAGFITTGVEGNGDNGAHPDIVCKEVAVP
jgi:basic membrane protein A